jgi:hypothetical protein
MSQSSQFQPSRSALGLIPEPLMVHWYFANRLKADLGTGFTAPQIQANDRYWSYICEHDTPPSSDWLAANHAEADALVLPISGEAKATKPERSARAGYMRDYMRQRRKKAR